MKNKGRLTLIGTLCLALALAAVSFMAACAKPAPAPTIELKIASFQPPLHKSSEMLENWAKKIEEETGGKVKFTLFAGQTLAKAKATYDAGVTGIADVVWTFAGYSPGRFSLSEVTNLPGLGFKNSTHAAQALADLWEMFPEIREQYKDTHVLWLSAAPHRQLFSLEPAPHIEDLKGMKIRAPGGLFLDILTALGASAVSMPGGEVYMALERGVIDAVMTNIGYATDNKFYEVTDYHIDFPLSGGMTMIAMSRNSYDSLPSDIQAIFQHQKPIREYYHRFFDASLNTSSCISFVTGAEPSVLAGITSLSS